MIAKVKPVAVTMPLIDECKTGEDLIAYCARVSNPANQANHDTSQKLLKYLVKNKHWSPFEMAHMVIEINTTRDIGRQILRHRSFSFQEFSQRYASVELFEDELFEFRECRTQDTTNRQKSVTTKDEVLMEMFEEAQEAVQALSIQWYKTLLNNGVAKEQARCLLPEGNTRSRMYMAGTVRSWIHYCELRMGNGTQLEHQFIATECWKILTKYFPSLNGLIDIST
jgi:thymidylate synthase (FAD)